MFEHGPATFATLVADTSEPDCCEQPACAASATAAQRLIQLLELSPAERPTDEIALFEPGRLSAGARIDLLTLLEQQKHWLDSVQQQVLAEIDAADASELNLSQEAVSLALAIPTRAAQSKLKTASLLVQELSDTLALLHAGQISYRHTEVICEQAWSLPLPLVAEFEALALTRAADQTVGQLRQAARRAAVRIDPANAEQRHQHAVTGRKVGFQPCEDGMMLLPVLLDAPQGQLIFTRLTAAATLLPAADSRTMDQKRADLLVDAVLSGLPHDALPELQGRRPSIQIVVSADTLLGLDDEPADLAGYGPITAETARRYAADQSGTWRRLLTDPDTSALLDIGRDSYRPVQRLRDFVLARDSVCCFPTCGQPGYRCVSSTSSPSPRVGRPAGAVAPWPASGTICARSAPVGSTAGCPMAAIDGPMTPATSTPAIRRSAGLPRASPADCKPGRLVDHRPSRSVRTAMTVTSPAGVSR